MLKLGAANAFSVSCSAFRSPGGCDARNAKAIAAVEVSRREVELKQRKLEAEIASAIATAQGAYASLHIANEGAGFMQENAALMQRAYALGEAELQTMLLVRRQATAAENSALQAQISCPAGLLWVARRRAPDLGIGP